MARHGERVTRATMNIGRMLKCASNLSRALEVLKCWRSCIGSVDLIGGYLGLTSPAYPMEFRTRDGDTLILERFEDLVTAWIIFLREDYPVDGSCSTIIDAGANIGVFSLYATRHAPGARVLALEPFPPTFERLIANVSRSPGADRIECRPCGLGRSDGLRMMEDAPTMASQHRGFLADPGGARGTPVESVTLDTLWRREGLGRVDLLKMDIQGSEYEVMAAASEDVLRRIDSVVMEYHAGGSKVELFGRLLGVGFELVWDHPEAAAGYGIALFRLRDGDS